MMNATSLYVSTCRLVIQANIDDKSSWTDLYRLVPYLRQSLSCTVCGNLLIEPHTPTETNCQHHVCRTCKGGRKKLKPSCSWCKDYDKYVENVQLRILLQCYKKLCEYVTSTSIYQNLLVNSTSGNGTGTSSLIELIQEGAGFKDEFKSTAGLSKSAYSILPCVYTSSSTQTPTASAPVTMYESNTNSEIAPPIKTLSNGSSLYSVMYSGKGSNKLTIKRKNTDVNAQSAERSTCSGNSTAVMSQRVQLPMNVGPSIKKPSQQKSTNKNGNSNSKVPANKRKGCRCGNATPTPGKLTCCGQRCPCYVESKACIDCRCRGCRNPHRPGGHKVRPLIPELQNYQIHLSPTPPPFSIPHSHHIGSVTSSNYSSHDTQAYATLDSPSHCLSMSSDLSSSNIQVLGVYTTQLQHVSSSLPAALLVGDDNLPSTESSDETSDVDVDI